VIDLRRPPRPRPSSPAERLPASDAPPPPAIAPARHLPPLTGLWDDPQPLAHDAPSHDGRPVEP
jgi:hypothetical protein